MAETSDLQRVQPPGLTEDPISIVRRDLHESVEFKRRFWPSNKIMARRRAYKGDPEAFAWPYVTLNQAQGPRPVDNWTFRQINHKVGKLQRVPTRLNLVVDNMTADPDMRLRLEALKQRLTMKARDSHWKRARRKMLTESAKTGLAVRAIGIDMSTGTPKIMSMPVAAEEYHRDPSQETLETASFSCWRRWVSRDSVLDSLRKAGYDPSQGGSSMDFAQDGRDENLDIPDDLILERNANSADAPWVPRERVLLTDHYSTNRTVDIYYRCPECGEEATVDRFYAKDETFPIFHCQNCDTTLEDPTHVDFSQMSKGPRYPYGRHIRILGKSAVVWDGPNALPIEGIHPFIELPWYDSDYFVGYSEVELLNSPQVMNNVALAMVADNAIFNSHPKKVIVEGGLKSAGNNSPDDWIQLSAEAIGTFKELQPGMMGEAAKILLERSIADMYALAGNDPVAHGTQPDTLRSGVGVARVIAASEVSLYLLQDQLFETESRYFEIMRDMCRAIDSPAFMEIKHEGTGAPQPFAYDRTLMQPNVRIQVVADREIDQEREELFSRAIELYGLGDPYIDWDLLHELSGLPPDLIAAAQRRIFARAAGLPPEMLPQLLGGAGGGGPGPQPGVRANAGGARSPAPAPGGGRESARAGAHAPAQTRPPSRSRGGQTPTSPQGGGF